MRELTPPETMRYVCEEGPGLEGETQHPEVWSAPRPRQISTLSLFCRRPAGVPSSPRFALTMRSQYLGSLAVHLGRQTEGRPRFHHLLVPGGAANCALGPRGRPVKTVYLLETKLFAPLSTGDETDDAEEDAEERVRSLNDLVSTSRSCRDGERGLGVGDVQRGAVHHSADIPSIASLDLKLDRALLEDLPTTVVGLGGGGGGGRGGRHFVNRVRGYWLGGDGR
jgi:hypothetical protein